jgi:predicted aspartyl protease
MIRYQYVAEFTPSAPFVHVIVRNPKADHASAEIPAQLDTGADRTVIPKRVAEEVHLSAVRKITVAGLGGDLHTLDVFLVLLQIRDLQPMAVEVIAHDDESFVLLGRDVINQLRIVLDGPNQVLEIG